MHGLQRLTCSEGGRGYCSFAYSALACSRCRVKTLVSIIFGSSNNPQCTFGIMLHVLDCPSRKQFSNCLGT